MMCLRCCERWCRSRLHAVTNCEPDVAALPALVDGLNASNDFGVFVRAMRREFKALVAGEAPQHGQLP